MVARIASTRQNLPRQFLRHSFAYRAALHEDGTVDGFDRDIPAVPGDAVRAILKGGRPQTVVRLPSRRHERRDRRAVDQHPHRHDFILVDRCGAVEKVFRVFCKQRQLRVGWKLDDDGAAAGGLFLTRLAMPFSVDMQRRQQAEREEDERNGDERGYEVAHLVSPGSPVQ